MSPDSPLFWSPQRSRGYTVGGIRLVLTDVLRRAGVKPRARCSRTPNP